jgi:hypothetical protein
LSTQFAADGRRADERLGAGNERLRRCCVLRRGEEMTEGREERRTRKGFPLYLVEKRKGKLWRYGSIVLCIALWAELLVALFR